METYIDRIKRLKNEKKMTNEQLAEASGIPMGTLSKLLAGMNDSPKLGNVIAICNALQCSVEYVVTGAPENTNNYTLSSCEIDLIERYRTLDSWGQELVETVLEKAAQRPAAISEGEAETAAPKEKRKSGARILQPITAGGRYVGERISGGKRPIKLYELPVSAGVGVYLDDAKAETISIPKGEKTADADYGLRISGNSMEPKYHNGDVLLVENADSVEIGEPGIFLLDGCGFFKIFGGDRLISLNDDYGPILLKDFSNVQCKGRVVGRLRRK
ncbi:MAG: helix-turn-helix domain-containing protein [Ruminococcaceae bacterium]|nr:helix-turn-helix domain-containing protein [Oscillospiraceae bacterium]